MIHVNTNNTAFAATTVLDVLSKHRVPWLVWSVGDEGLCMAPDGERTAEGIRKYWPAQIIGSYRHGVTHDDFMLDINGRWFVREDAPAKPERATPRHKGRPRSAKANHVAAARMLAFHPMDVDQLATALGVGRDRAKNVVHYLVQSKRVRSQQTWSSSRKRYVPVYRAVTA